MCDAEALSQTCSFLGSVAAAVVVERVVDHLALVAVSAVQDLRWRWLFVFR
jgi:hypothetical protein